MKQDNTKFLKNLPPKGTSDWFPEECEVRKYMFEIFRDVCKSFGYEEYMTPTFEKADIYRAKSGEDVGGKELMIFRDKVNREFALRPEMTPSVSRMITRIYNNQPKPIRFFSIANFFRNEKPQKGRKREFWQLNYDLFGSKSIYADLEIIKIALEIMLRFLPKDKVGDRDYKPFVMYINDKRIIEEFLTKDIKVKKESLEEVLRILDKKDKIKMEEFVARLKKENLNKEQIEKMKLFMENKISIEDKMTGDIKKLMELLKRQGYEKWVEFKPSLVRGFDYYTGIVYEIYDNSKENNRSLFGGGRYDGLGKIFGDYDIPAVGVAPGDETIKIFLENWNLLENIKTQEKKTIYIPLIEENAKEVISNLAQKLRTEGNIVLEGLEKQSISKSLDFANKKKTDKVIIIGSDELKNNQYTQKDMKTGNQTVILL